MLSPSNYEIVEKIYLSPTIKMTDVSFNGKSCYFLARGDGKQLCAIYGSRFTMCRLVPLAITALPNGELLVNLIHCNGVSLDDGELVDETFVNKTLDSVNGTGDSFLKDFITSRKSYHDGLFNFYTIQELTDFSTKRRFLGRMSGWLASKSLSKRRVDFRISAIEELLSNELSKKLQKLFNTSVLRSAPLILFEEDVEKMADELEKSMETKLERICDTVELQRRTEILEILSKKKMMILNESIETKEYSLGEKISYYTPYMDQVEVKVEDLLKEKPVSESAMQVFEDYVAEVLNRIDQGGFPIDVPIVDVLESMQRYSQDILTHAKVYSTQNAEINENNMNDAISRLENFNALGSITRQVFQEGMQHLKRPF